jgi:exopolyphosphatase/pppGpp-phosphohydrolase
MNGLDTTRLHLDAHRTTFSSTGRADAVAQVGIDDLAEAIFRHDPPTPAELERAIDVVEDALMATRLPHEERGGLVTSAPVLRDLPGLGGEGARLSRDEVEALFQRLASASLGDPSAAAGLPTDGRHASALLILRECMHHLGHAFVQADPA